MSALLLDGNALSKKIKAQVKSQVGEFTEQHGFAPILAVIRVGDDGAAAGYARAIEKNCKSVDVGFRGVELPANATQFATLETLAQLNNDPTIHGIMILEPVPAQINLDALVLSLNPNKDIDGVHPLNAGRLASQRPPYFVPATPAGGIQLLEEAGIRLQGQTRCDRRAQ